MEKSEQTSKMNETLEQSFSVRVLNESLDIGEKIARMGSVEGTSLLRKATLRFDNQNIELGCQDDLGSYHNLAQLSYDNIERVKYKKTAITPGQQIIKPAMSGAFLGIVLCIIIFFKVKDNMVVSSGEMFGIMIGLVLFISFIYTLVNIGKITWTNLAVVVFEEKENRNLEFSIKDDNLDSILNIAKSKNIKDISEL